MCHLLHAQEAEPGRLNKCRAHPLSISRWGKEEEGFGVKMRCSEYICVIIGMEDRFAGEWEWDHHAL